MKVTARTVVVFVVVSVGIAWWAYEEYIRDHEEPIVVDNGPIRISRPDADPPTKDNDRRWNLRRSHDFIDLLADATDTAGSARPPVHESLADARAVVVEYVTQSTTAPMTVGTLRFFRRGPVGLPFLRSLRMESSNHPIDPVDGGKLGLRDGDAFRVGRITIENEDGSDRVVCVREPRGPFVESSGSRCTNTGAPEEAHVRFCFQGRPCQ